MLMMAWGGVSMAHAGIKNNGTLIGLRLLLGALEAGFYPTAIYFVSCCYPRYSLATRIGGVSCLFVFGSAWAGLIAYGIFKRPSHMVLPWQELFLVEGGVTIALAVVILFALPKNVGSAWFLSAEERAHAVHRMELDQGSVYKNGSAGHKTTLRDVKEAVSDWPKMIIVLCNLVTTIPVSAFGVFLPLILQGEPLTPFQPLDPSWPLTLRPPLCADPPRSPLSLARHGLRRHRIQPHERATVRSRHCLCSRLGPRL